MTVMMRTRTRPAPAAATAVTRTRTRPAEAPEAAAPERKLFRAKKADPAVIKAEQIKIIENKLQLIAIDYDRIEHLQKRIQPEIEERRASIAKQEADIRAALKLADMQGYSDGKYEALFEAQKGRGTRIFDNKKVYNALKNRLDDFLSIVKVQATEVSTVMNEREIEEVSTWKPGEEKEPLFVCRKVPQKKVK